MSNSIQAVHAASATTQTIPPAGPPAKAAQSSTPQDTVNISSAAQQALAKAASTHDVDHDGDRH
jgi:hypothetical protein